MTQPCPRCAHAKFLWLSPCQPLASLLSITSRPFVQAWKPSQYWTMTSESRRETLWCMYWRMQVWQQTCLLFSVHITRSFFFDDTHRSPPCNGLAGRFIVGMDCITTLIHLKYNSFIWDCFIFLLNISDLRFATWFILGFVSLQKTGAACQRWPLHCFIKN